MANENAWQIPIESTIVVNAAQISHIEIHIQSDQTIKVDVDWQLISTANEVVQQGRKTFTETEIDGLLQSGGSSVAAIRQLFVALASSVVAPPSA